MFKIGLYFTTMDKVCGSACKEEDGYTYKKWDTKLWWTPPKINFHADIHIYYTYFSVNR